MFYTRPVRDQSHVGPWTLLDILHLLAGAGGRKYLIIKSIYVLRSLPGLSARAGVPTPVAVIGGHLASGTGSRGVPFAFLRTRSASPAGTQMISSFAGADFGTR